VEISNIEGHPDKPVIRQILPIGHNLPDVKPGEQLQQQRAEVFQHVTTDGSWRRKTNQQIQEEKRVKRSRLMWRFFIQAAICDMLNTSTCGVHYETKIKVCCHCCYCYSSDSITGSGAS